MSPIRIAILSDNRLFSEGLERLLSSESSFTIVGTDDGTSFSVIVQETAPHILLADGQMEGALTLIPADGSRPWAIVLSAETDDIWAVKALETGARGVLSKEANGQELHKAILVVHEGQIWARQQVVSKIVEHVVALSGAGYGPRHSMVGRLSAREQEIVRNAANGLSNQEIADRLAISQATVKAHLTRIFQKVRVRDRGQLAALYHRTFSAQWRSPSE